MHPTVGLISTSPASKIEAKLYPERVRYGERVEGHYLTFFCYILKCADHSFYAGVAMSIFPGAVISELENRECYFDSALFL